MTLKALLARMRAAISCKKTTKLRKRRLQNSEKQLIDSSGSGHRLSTVVEQFEPLLGGKDGKMGDAKSACSCSECLFQPRGISYDDNPVVDLYKSQELEASRDHCFSTKIPLSTLTVEEWIERCDLLKDKIQELKDKVNAEERLVIEQDRYATCLAESRCQLAERYRVLADARGWFGKR